MTQHADNSMRAEPVPADEDVGSEIELEPTVHPGGSPLAGASGSFHMALVEGTSPSTTQESGELLRRRLRAAAVFLAVAYAMFFVVGLIGPSSAHGAVRWYLGLRAAFCLAVAALLSSRPRLSHPQLRAVELGFFGVLVVAMLVTQYVTGSALISREDLPRLVWLEKNGLLNFLLLMVLYGALIPNEPKATARVVLTMALGPLLVLLALQVKIDDTPGMADAFATEQLPIGNTIYLLVSAGLAIYVSYVLHGLRKDLHHARQLGQYQLGEKLGQGGMGEVYLAEHLLLKRPCALKLIRPDLNTSPVAVARFEREVKSAAMLSHPSTIEIFDYGHTEDGTFYYVMEYLPGLPVSDLVHQFGSMPPARAVYLLRQVCGSLAEAHRLGLVHRDLKPANIFVAILGGKCDIAKVLDFGLVKLTTPDAPQLTADFTVSGTPQYMAPEQAAAWPDVDGRADIYAVGAILYFVLTGRPPFQGTNPTELMIAHARDPVVPPSRIHPNIPADLEAVVMRALAKRPADRYPDARSLSQALAACACAGDWNEESAEQWWVGQAATHREARTAQPPSATHV